MWPTYGTQQVKILSEGTAVSKPHGGNLVNRFSNIDPSDLSSISISADLANDVENIADGIFSPLEGFLSQQDFENVVEKGRLSNDIPWTIPIVLDVDESTASKIKDSGNVLLKNPDGLGVAVLNVEEVFTFDKEKTVKGVYGTTDNSHPGVAKTMAMNDFLVSGKIDYVKRPENTEIRKIRMTPLETREAFSKAGWKKIVAFQTRNPPHVAHEILQKTAITTRDGVFVNPLIGKKKSGDFKDEVIIKSYEAMIENYYPENRCKLGTLHTEMRFAGPKEAIHHAIIRQNLGFSYFIIGRDHAGVGNFYKKYESFKLINSKIQFSFFFLLWKKISDALGAGIGAVFSLQGERPAKLSSQLKELAASCIDIGKDEGRYIVHPASILD